MKAIRDIVDALKRLDQRSLFRSFGEKQLDSNEFNLRNKLGYQGYNVHWQP